MTGDKFVQELQLKQPGFTSSTCEAFTKHCERIQKFRETGNLKHLHRNELDQACFAHDAAYSDSKDLIKRTTWRESIFAGINFHEFGEFLTISRKLVPAKIIGDCATRKIREN